MTTLKLKSFEQLKREGLIFNVYDSGDICLHSKGVYKMVDKKWMEGEIEVTEKTKKTISQDDYEQTKDFYEVVEKQNLNEVMPEKETVKVPIND